jgi:hypothetical protein
MAEPSILGALRDPQFRSDTLRNLVEALNGAKRSLTVGSLGAVGDMGNTLANLVRAGAGTAYHETTGRPIPQALEYRDPARDFGTSASLGNFAEQQGWLPPQTFSMPEQAGALLGPIVAMKAPDLAQSTLRGLVSALKSEPSRRMVEGYMGGMGMKPQAIVYHGSPHQFDAFDSSKIGTGEGAQAYGHGLYLAETPAVAKQYKTAGTDHAYNRVTGGMSPMEEFASDKAAQGVLGEDLFSAMYNKYGRLLTSDKEMEAFDAAIKRAEQSAGSLYKVDLPDPLIARMLDWDKPLSQQAPEVQRALQKMGVDATSSKYAEPKQWHSAAYKFLSSKAASKIVNTDLGAAEDIYAARKAWNRGPEAMQEYLGSADGQWLRARLTGARGGDQSGGAYLRKLMDEKGGYGAMLGQGGGQFEASKVLRDAGIPGIRYLDGGSRADGAGTSNFVVFPGEESALTILERNGKPVRR